MAPPPAHAPAHHESRYAEHDERERRDRTERREHRSHHDEPDYGGGIVAPGGVQPHRVEDPVLWLLSKTGTVKSA